MEQGLKILIKRNALDIKSVEMAAGALGSITNYEIWLQGNKLSLVRSSEISRFYHLSEQMNLENEMTASFFLSSFLRDLIVSTIHRHYML